MGGEATADIVRLFAEDHEAWQESFFNAWEKMQLNGYYPWELTQASDNGHLLSQTEWYTDPMAGCAYPNWAADQWCDDENNNAECNILMVELVVTTKVLVGIVIVLIVNAFNKNFC